MSLVWLGFTMELNRHTVRSFHHLHQGQSAFFAISPEDLPRATFAKTIESIVEPLFSPAHFPAQKTASAVWHQGAFQFPKNSHIIDTIGKKNIRLTPMNKVPNPNVILDLSHEP